MIRAKFLRTRSYRNHALPAMLGVDLAFLIPVQVIGGVVAGATAWQIIAAVFVTSMVLVVLSGVATV